MRVAFTCLALLVIFSCSNLNRVRTDGSRELNGSIVDVLYIETDRGGKLVTSKLIEKFGQPTKSSKNELIWDYEAKNEIANEPITMTILLDSISHYQEQKKKFDYVNVVVCLVDKGGTDLMTNARVRSKGQEIFQELFDEIE